MEEMRAARAEREAARAAKEAAEAAEAEAAGDGKEEGAAREGEGARRQERGRHPPAQGAREDLDASRRVSWAPCSSPSRESTAPGRRRRPACWLKRSARVRCWCASPAGLPPQSAIRELVKSETATHPDGRDAAVRGRPRGSGRARDPAGAGGGPHGDLGPLRRFHRRLPGRGARAWASSASRSSTTGSPGNLEPDVTFLLEVEPATGGQPGRRAGPLRARGRGRCSARSRRRMTSSPRVTPTATCASTRRARGRGARGRAGPAAGARVIEALEHQPRARIALEAAVANDAGALARVPVPRAGRQRQAARREGVCRGADLRRRRTIPQDAERRVLSGVHPDLTWVEPRGAHDILVDDMRTRIVRQAALRPFESRRRVFVIVDADRMNDESQNSLLKTLEEPAPFAHFVLVSSAPGRLLETIPSRCRPVRFGAIPPARVAEALQARGSSGAHRAGLRAACRRRRRPRPRARRARGGAARRGRGRPPAPRCRITTTPNG